MMIHKSKATHRFLLLASYCDEDCTEELPCQECLEACNVCLIPVGTEVTVLSGLDLLRAIDKGEIDQDLLKHIKERHQGIMDLYARKEKKK